MEGAEFCPEVSKNTFDYSRLGCMKIWIKISIIVNRQNQRSSVMIPWNIWPL